MQTKPVTSLLCLAIAAACQLLGQAAAKPGTDVLVLANGEKLIGHLERATDTSVVFKSDTAGEVTVKWSAVAELHSSDKFAAIPKGVKLRHKEDTAAIPQGPVSATAENLEIQTPPQPKTTPTTDIGNVVDEASFEHAFEHVSLWQGWKGGATAGIALTEATQKSRNITAGINLVRSVPDATWLDTRSRTIFGFNEAYGKVSQPGYADVKTSLYHLGLEQDWFLNPRLYGFVHAGLDHNFSQGLRLQQVYGGGLGFVVFKKTSQELDFKASLDYINQRFYAPGSTNSLIGSVFSESYTRTFAHGILFNEAAGLTQPWNVTSAYSAFASAALTFPVYHRLGLTLGALDNFLNNPPPGFRKNSFQFTAGATYSFQ
ncbi:MAG TPA: DUF481 domain-containing protein [Bryobacteraceae bacterium]|jgi:hypothetical protein|nr:DUF481 domain-containing protein [Bryobacteraceae bacterium]